MSDNLEILARDALKCLNSEGGVANLYGWVPKALCEAVLTQAARIKELEAAIQFKNENMVEMIARAENQATLKARAESAERERDTRAAEGAIMSKLLTKFATLFGRKNQDGASLVRIVTGEGSWVHEAKEVLANLAPLAAAFLRERDEAVKRARTPGTQEICVRCGTIFHDGQATSVCKAEQTACPLRAAQSGVGGEE